MTAVAAAVAVEAIPPPHEHPAVSRFVSHPAMRSGVSADSRRSAPDWTRTSAAEISVVVPAERS